MVCLLADSGTNNAVGWSVFAAPIGVVLGAVIGAAINFWNARETVYKRLETLIGIRKSWPDGVAGVETIDRSIELALADVRRREPGHAGEVKTPGLARLAEQAARRGQAAAAVMTAVAAVAAALVSVITTYLASGKGSGHQAAPNQWLVWVVAGGAFLVAVALPIAVMRRVSRRRSGG
jgi:hypothetical protein